MSAPFEIDPKKTEQFFASVDKQAYDKAMDRARKHGCDPIKHKTK